MLTIGIICVVIAGVSAGYSSSAGSSAGAGSGTYNSYGTYGSKYPYNSNQYSGGYVGTSTGNVPFTPYPNFPPIPSPYDYNNFVNNFLGNFASFYNSLYNQNLQHQQAIFNSINSQFPHGGGYAGGYSGSYAPNFAAASGSYGPSGFHQTASIYPQNPNKPNLDTRFGDDGGAGQVSYSNGPPGFVGVSTASFSSSSDVNGQKQSHREAITSVNDNGKVTTYRVHN